jgi:hypothetical protein
VYSSDQHPDALSSTAENKVFISFMKAAVTPRVKYKPRFPPGAPESTGLFAPSAHAIPSKFPHHMNPGKSISEQLPSLAGIFPFVDAFKHQPHLVQCH